MVLFRAILFKYKFNRVFLPLLLYIKGGRGQKNGFPLYLVSGSTITSPACDGKHNFINHKLITIPQSYHLQYYLQELTYRRYVLILKPGFSKVNF